MEAGSIYLYKDFRFKNSTRDKLLVVVNSPKTENYLFCMTTSKENPPHRLKKRGCNAKKNYFMFFPKDDCVFKKYLGSI